MNTFWYQFVDEVGYAKASTSLNPDQLECLGSKVNDIDCGDRRPWYNSDTVSVCHICSPQFCRDMLFAAMLDFHFVR